MKASHGFVSVGVGVVCGAVIGANCALWCWQEHAEQAAGRQCCIRFKLSHLVETFGRKPKEPKHLVGASDRQRVPSRAGLGKSDL